MRSNSERPGRGGAGLRTQRRTRFAGLVAALAAAVLLAAGCSSASSSSSTAPAASGSTASGSTASGATASGSATPGKAGPAKDIGITATTIRVGLIADVNTPVQPGLFQKSVDAMKAWAAMVNASGGLDGRQVTVDFCDSKLDPNATANCVIPACQNDFALVGTSSSALADITDLDGCKNAAGKAIGLPNLAAFAFPPLSCDKSTYLPVGLGTYCATAQDATPTYTVPVGDTRYFLSQNKDLHGIWLYNSDVPTFKITQTPQFQAGVNLGIKKDGQGYYGLSGEAPQSALTPFTQVLKSSGSTYVYGDGTPPNMVLLRREAQLQGINSVKVWVCNSGCYDPSFIQQGGSAVNNTYVSLYELPYLSDYQANPTLDKLVTKLGGVNNLNNNALNSFIMALLFQDAVQKVAASGATLDRASLFAALNDEHAFTAQGIIGPTDVGRHAPSPCMVIAQVQNGAWKRVFPAKAGTFDCSSQNLATIKLKVS